MPPHELEALLPLMQKATYHLTGNSHTLEFDQSPDLLGWTFVSEVSFFGTPGVPEPSTWAMMLLGFGGIGWQLRRRRRSSRRLTPRPQGAPRERAAYRSSCDT